MTAETWTTEADRRRFWLTFAAVLGFTLTGYLLGHERGQLEMWKRLEAERQRAQPVVHPAPLDDEPFVTGTHPMPKDGVVR